VRVLYGRDPCISAYSLHENLLTFKTLGVSFAYLKYELTPNGPLRLAATAS